MLTSKKTQAVPSFDDIVFENRNRNYGAYKLRRDYDGNVIKAFLITVGAVLLITGHSLIKDLFVNKEAAPLEVNLDVITFQRPPEILDAKPENAPIKKEKPEPASGGKKETIPVIVPIDSIPELSAKDTASTSPGPGPSTGKVTLPFKPGGNADSTAGSAGIIPAKKEPTDYPDIMPEFPGGDAELFRYLGKSIKYPKIPLSARRSTARFIPLARSSKWVRSWLRVTAATRCGKSQRRRS